MLRVQISDSCGLKHEIQVGEHPLYVAIPCNGSDENDVMYAEFCNGELLPFSTETSFLCVAKKRRPFGPRIVENYPHLPAAQVAHTAATDYLTLLNG